MRPISHKSNNTIDFSYQNQLRYRYRPYVCGRAQMQTPLVHAAPQAKLQFKGYEGKQLKKL